MFSDNYLIISDEGKDLLWCVRGISAHMNVYRHFDLIIFLDKIICLFDEVLLSFHT